jgi:hypothetical protein
MIRPFIGLIFGSGDDDPNDDELGGFMTLPMSDITGVSATRYFDSMDVGFWGDNNGPAAPARAGFAGGNTGRHASGNPFNNVLGNDVHLGIDTQYSNPGTLLIPVGVEIAPLKGHQILLYYQYVGMTDASSLRAAAALEGIRTSKIHNNFFHELGLSYVWTINPHFDFRVVGLAAIPADGSKDIAQTQDCDIAPGLQSCEGEDVALKGEIRFRGRF